MSKKTYRIACLGCRSNQYEAQGYRDQLEQLGFSEAGPGESADISIVNTCTVTESADSSSRNQIRRLARQSPKGRLVVTGCMVDSAKDALDGIEGISLVVENTKKEKLMERIFPEERALPEFSIRRFQAHTRAFVKVQDGCNSFCTYCIIPYVRGRSRSRPVDAILKEVETLIQQGYKEVVLTGINIGDYEYEGLGLADLVSMVDGVPGLERLRISSIDPDEVDDTLLRAVIEGKKTCPSMHIVLQSGSNVVLKRMNRKYTRQEFYYAVDRLESACGDFTFTTDVIVGFPGETEKDFQETLQVMEEVAFTKVHMFPFSPRPRTRAAIYPRQISDEVKDRRRRQLMQEAEKIAFQGREKYVGRRMRVLTESEGFGHTDNFLPVRLTEAIPANRLVNVDVVKNGPEGLIACL